MANNPFRKLTDYLASSFTAEQGSSAKFKVAVFAGIVLPIAALAIFSYGHLDKQLTQFSFLRRQSIAYLAASTLRSKFDSAVEVVSLMAESPSFQKLAAEGKWQEGAVAFSSNVGGDSLIEYVVITDKDGMRLVQVGGPVGAEPNLRNENWFKGLSRNWNAYVSDIHENAPGADGGEVIAAVPIRNDQDEVIGAMAGHVNLETLAGWTRNIDAGSQAEVIFVDRVGQAVVQSLMTGGRIFVTDLSAFGPVASALNSDRGVNVVYDPVRNEQSVVAFEPVIRYGWAAIVKQPVYAAFALRNSDSFFLLTVYAILVALDILLALLIISALNSVANANRREKTIFKSVGEGLIVVDRHARVTNVNPAAEALFGWTRKELLGRDFLGSIVAVDEHNRPMPSEQRPVWRALAGQKNSGKLLFLRKDGGRFPAAVTAAPLIVGEGTNGAAMIFRDVSKEDELDHAKKEFISVASHQLLTPVSAIKGFLSLLLDGDFGPITEKQKEYLSKLFHLSERLIEMVDDLLNVSRIDMGATDTAVEKTDLAAFIKGEVEAIKTIALNKRQTIEETYGPSIGSLTVSTKLLRSVIQNLLSNAIKYTPDGGKIFVELKRATDKEVGECFIFSVKDTGYGIPDSAKAKIFQKFYRADNVRMMGAEGTGLGLYIVNQVVSLLRGRIWFESEEGKGTTFFVAFPERGQQELI